MKAQTTKSIAVIGAGISGIGVARILKAAGHTVTLFEKSGEVGGIWATTYPGVSLQNTRRHYYFADFNYPQTPNLHPTGQQIRDYLQQAVAHFDLDLHLNHEIVQMEPQADGWNIEINSPEGQRRQSFDFAVIATGQYNGEKPETDFPGREKFSGRVVTEIDVDDLNAFDDKRVAVVGFGKSAVDMAVFAKDHGAKVQHIFRAPRWLIPFDILGIHYSRLLFNRASTSMLPSWSHGSWLERFMHRHLKFLTNSVWVLIESILKLKLRLLARQVGPAALERLKLVTPTHSLVPDLRSAIALAPVNYYRYVAEGFIAPHMHAVSAFNEAGLTLDNGDAIDCDTVVFAIGSKTPAFRFLPEAYRKILESEDDGTQLYRHMIHPQIPNLAFAGFNHGFMHVPAAEVGGLWLAALIEGKINLPSESEQLQAIEHIRAWKREHIHFEPSRSCAVNTRYQQYIDIVLKDLGLNPYRKMPNFIAEVFGEYGAGDYTGLVDEYMNSESYHDKKTPLSLPM